MGDTALASRLYLEKYIEFDSMDARVVGMQLIQRDKDVYGDIPVVFERSVTATFAGFGQKREQLRLADLPDVFRQESVSEFSVHVSKNAESWAKLVAFMCEFRIVIFDSVRFSPLSEQGYSLAELAPRVEGDELVFHLLEFDDDARDYVPKKVRWSISRQVLVS